MLPPSRLRRFAWLLAALACCCFVLWSAHRRAARIDQVSAATGESLVVDANSPTGFAGGKRWLIVPEGNAQSYAWIAQTQQALKDGAWRIRTVDYDNAPKGRPVNATSPYRWWLATVARATAAFSDLPLAACVERAALYSEPALQVLLILLGSAVIAWTCGSGPGAFTAAALTVLFPLNAVFIPGQPGPAALALVFVAFSLFRLVGGVAVSGQRPGHTRLAFLLAGMTGGLALWTDAPSAANVLFAVSLAAALALWLRPPAGQEDSATLPWLAWAGSGAVVCGAAFLFERLPQLNRSFDLTSVSLVHVFGWLGAGITLRHLGELRQHGRRSLGKARLVGLAFGAVAWSAAIAFAVSGFVNKPAASLMGYPRFSKLPGSLSPSTLWEWFTGGGDAGGSLLLLLPVASLAALAFLLRRFEPGTRPWQVFGMGLALFATAVGAFALPAWPQVNLALLGAALLMFARSRDAATSPAWLRFAPALLFLLFLPGLIPLLRSIEEKDAPVTEVDVQALMERDLAHWLANQSDGRALVLASPTLGTSLFFHGGLRVVASVFLENAEGLAAALRISSTNRQDEAYALAQNRQITHIVSASWDPFLEEYARRTSGEANNTFVELLSQWLPPRWLRPVAFQVPQVPGVKDHSVLVYEAVELQEQGVALSRLAEYFIELGLLDQAAAVVKTIEEHFPKDLSGGVARAQFGIAVNEPQRFVAAMNTTLADLTPEAFETLPFDRKISFVLALAQAERFDILRELVPQLLANCDAASLRSLSASHLFRLVGILRALGMQLPEPLAETARGLLPPELRSRI